MKKFYVVIAMVFLTGIIFSCKETGNIVVIYTSTADYRTAHIDKLLKEKFPDYNIIIQTLPAQNLADKLKTEGIETEADIILSLETGYLEDLQDEILADLSGFDLSEFLPELVPASKLFLPWDRSSGAIIINRTKLENDGLPVPASYHDLLNPVFRGKISMPNPKSSGTGYMFLVSLVNAWGEDAAFSYFDSLAENILQFTASDSDTVNALIREEAAIGLGMIPEAVNAVNNMDVQFEFYFFEEGAPYITTGFGIIKGKDERPVVKEVFEFAITKLVKDDKELFCPEAVMKNQANNIANYPEDIPYADMDGMYDLALKERFLEKWKY